MKITYKIDDRVTVEVEGDTQQEVFEQLAAATEVFGDNVCVAKLNGQIVESDKVKFVVRETQDGDKYFEKRCDDWDKKLNGFKKSFGCKKKGGGLFPKEMPEQEKLDRVPGLRNWYKPVRKQETPTPTPLKTQTQEEHPF